MAKTLLRLAAVRRNCLECSGGNAKCVAYCPCDGLHSTHCEFWLFRFGCSPQRAARRYGHHAVTPGKMPPATALLDSLPPNLRGYQPGPSRRQDAAPAVCGGATKET